MSTFSVLPGISAAVELQARRLGKHPNPDEIVRTAHRIHEWLRPQGSFEQSLRYYIQAVDSVARSIHDVPDLHASGSSLMTALSWLYAKSIAYDRDGERILREHVRILRQTARVHPLEEYRVAASRSITHLERLKPAYRRRIKMKQTIRDVFSSVSTEIVPEDVWENAAKDAAFVAGQIGRHRRYGVKPCVMQDGIWHEWRDAWVFLDGFDELSGVPEEYRRALRPPLAISHLAVRQGVKRLGMAVNRYDIASTQGLIVVAPKYSSRMTVVVQQSGELTVDIELGVYPLRELFKEAECEEMYDVFSLIHLLRLSDLIVPEYIRQQYDAPPWPALPELRREREAHHQGLHDQIRRLRVPRLRLLKNAQVIERALEKEHLEDLQETERLQSYQPPRSMGSRIGHFRRLPPGYQASPEAISWALYERGMQPPSGYTYVKNRTVDDDTVHVAQRRRH